MTASSADLAADSSGQLSFLSGRPPRSLKSPQEVLKCRNLQVNDYVTGAGQLTRGKQGLFKQLSTIIWSKAPQLSAGAPGSGPQCPVASCVAPAPHRPVERRGVGPTLLGAMSLLHTGLPLQGFNISIWQLAKLFLQALLPLSASISTGILRLIIKYTRMDEMFLRLLKRTKT